MLTGCPMLGSQEYASSSGEETVESLATDSDSTGPDSDESNSEVEYKWNDYLFCQAIREPFDHTAKVEMPYTNRGRTPPVKAVLARYGYRRLSIE